MLKKLYDALGKQVHRPYAVPFLAFLFFLEAIFFIPVDPLLVMYCIEHRSRALYFAAIATLASVAGGVAAYYIGFAIWEGLGQKLISFVTTEETFQTILHHFKVYEIWAVLIAGFTPIPYKAVTLAAGFCKLPLLPFIACSFVARGSRFFLVAGVIRTWGAQIKEYIDRYFNILVICFVLLIIVATWLLM